MAAAVEPRSPADRAGLKPGDTIIGIGGQRVSGIDDLQRLLSSEWIGQRLDLTVVRGNAKLSLEIVPVESSRPGTRA
jgi:serine protease Do